ncbi:hypothetical protein BD779DRAFT_1671436 [Infundibulicybe gibba]|nr:hypothetical protein BD779DRAFT_1671436 [Infundibulicybe gibba]
MTIDNDIDIDHCVDCDLKESEHLPQIDLASVLAEPNLYIDLRIRAAIATAFDRRTAHVAERKRLLELILEWKQEERNGRELSVAAFRGQLLALWDNHVRRIGIHGLNACQVHAGLFAEGTEKDWPLFHFTHVPLANPAREIVFMLQATEAGYGVETGSPTLPAMPLLVDALNSSGCV